MHPQQVHCTCIAYENLLDIERLRNFISIHFILCPFGYNLNLCTGLFNTDEIASAINYS